MTAQILAVTAQHVALTAQLFAVAARTGAQTLLSCNDGSSWPEKILTPIGAQA
jgi:hypothetical protein